MPSFGDHLRAGLVALDFTGRDYAVSSDSLERLPEFISDWQPIGHAAGRRPALPERGSATRSSLALGLVGNYFWQSI